MIQMEAELSRLRDAYCSTSGNDPGLTSDMSINQITMSSLGGAAAKAAKIREDQLVAMVAAAQEEVSYEIMYLRYEVI